MKIVFDTMVDLAGVFIAVVAMVLCFWLFWILPENFCALRADEEVPVFFEDDQDRYHQVP